MLPHCRFSSTLKGMEVHFTPDLQAKIDQLVVDTGYAPDKLVEDAMAGYVAELAQTRQMLSSRYDDLKSGRVKPIPGDEVEAWFREKSAAARRPQPGS
jgi:predicted transcriptional regulator